MLFQMYIDGQWCASGDGAVKDVINPATGEVLGQIPLATMEDVDRAAKAAYRASKEFEKMPVFERAELCYRVADAIMERQEEIAEALCKEHGKPYHTEALGEVAAGADSFKEAAEQIKWMEDSMPVLHAPNRRSFVFRKPVGVFGIITPWNFPIGTACTYYLGAALATGNAVLWNPATTTAAAASVFMKCLEDAKVPAGVVNLVIGPGSTVGDAIVVHELVGGIGFTGSTEVGNYICSRAKAKHTSMELGGNGPSIVFKDADLDLTADAIMAGSFSNAGQICTSTERVIVDDSVADELVEIMLKKIGNYKLGDPFDKATTMGPMHKMDTVNTVREHVEDALKKGAKLVCGGRTMPGAPTENFYEPTILDHVSRDALVNIEETFGPVLPLIRFKDEAEIESIVEDSKYRLFSAIFTRDIDKALCLAENSKFGAININDSSSNWDTAFPAGGGAGSLSGHGRSGGKYSIEDMTETRVVTVSLTNYGK